MKQIKFFLLFFSFQLFAAQNQADKNIELENVQIDQQEQKVEAEQPVVNYQRPQIVHDEGIVIGSDYDDRNTIARISENERARRAERQIIVRKDKLCKIGTLVALFGIVCLSYSQLGVCSKFEYRYTDAFCKATYYAGFTSLLALTFGMCLSCCLLERR